MKINGFTRTLAIAFLAANLVDAEKPAECFDPDTQLIAELSDGTPIVSDADKIADMTRDHVLISMTQCTAAGSILGIQVSWGTFPEQTILDPVSGEEVPQNIIIGQEHGLLDEAVAACETVNFSKG